MPHYSLDARHLLCPMPVIKTQNMIKQLAHGDSITIMATDPGAQQDLPAWCRIHGHILLSCHHVNNEVHIEIEVVKE